MRPTATAALAFLALLLSGCSQAGPAAAQDVQAPVQWWTPPLLVLADGTYQYHELSPNGGVPVVLEVYDFATQPVANPCSYDDGGAYFNNRAIPTPAGQQPARNGTLRVFFDWTDQDYPFPTMVAGYRAPGMEAVVDSPRIGRGETVELRIEPGQGGGAGGWALYACINRSDESPADPSWQTGTFLGSFTVHAEFQADPEPYLPDVVAEDPGRRTSRD